MLKLPGASVLSTHGGNVSALVQLVVFAVSPCPFALIKHLEHERRQITASHTGVLVHFRLSGGPWGTLPVFHRTGCDMGAVTAGPRGAPGSEQGALLASVSPGARCLTTYPADP